MTTLGPSLRTQVTREDWLDSAMTVLVEHGVEAVKVMQLAKQLGVARSSFYWHFADRPHLLDELLAIWRTRNTASIVERTRRATGSPQASVLAVFEAWMDPNLFDYRLDFAVRAWSRRDQSVAREFAAATATRVDALRSMFARHGFSHEVAVTRARVVYFTQLAYYELAEPESLSVRLANAASYVEVFTGEPPTSWEMEAFASVCQAISGTGGSDLSATREAGDHVRT